MSTRFSESAAAGDTNTLLDSMTLAAMVFQVCAVVWGFPGSKVCHLIQSQHPHVQMCVHGGLSSSTICCQAMYISTLTSHGHRGKHVTVCECCGPVLIGL
jgi:hypothetical protein